jgi:hypothetical protein
MYDGSLRLGQVCCLTSPAGASRGLGALAFQALAGTLSLLGQCTRLASSTASWYIRTPVFTLLIRG